MCNFLHFNSRYSMESKVRVMLLANSNAKESLFTKWKKRFLDIFDNTKVEFVTTDADILVFLTNNSAVNAIEEVRKNMAKPYFLMAVSSDKAYSSAVEVKAWMNQNGISSYAIVEYDSSETNMMVANLYDAKNAFARMSKKCIYIPNNPLSELLTSDSSPLVLATKFGMQVGYKIDETAKSINTNLCTGDICSAAGMLLVYELCGYLPQVAEIVNITLSTVQLEVCEDSAVLADCCGIKAKHLDMLDADEATVFRFDSTFSKAFVKTLQVKKRTESPLSVELSLDSATIDYLISDPLGNHHLILSGNHAQKLTLACLMKNMAIV